jgi:hypothetical protein
LADFCWEYLEAHQPLNARQEDYYIDHLASRLARFNPDRGFALLRRAILDERRGSRWNPLSSNQLFFWRELKRIDPARALMTVLDASRTLGTAGPAIGWFLPSLMDLQGDRDVLSEYASRGEAEALTIVTAITGGRPGFWPLAFELVNAHPENTPIRRDLELRVQQMGQVVTGPTSEHLELCRKDVEQALHLPEVPQPARSWLTDFEQRLARAVNEQRRQESDDRINSG